MRRVLVPVLLISCGALAACGSDSEPKTVTVRGSAPPAKLSATTPAIPVADKAGDTKIAKASVLRISDLPSGWEETDDNDGDDETKSPCQAITDAKRATTARASSNDFSKDEALVSSTSYVYPDEATASKFYDGLVSSENRRCIGEGTTREIRKNLKNDESTKDATLSDPTTSVVNTAPLGDDSATQRVKLTLTQNGFDQEFTVSLNYTRIGRALVLLVVQQSDDDILSQATTAAARHMKDALAG